MSDLSDGESISSDCKSDVAGELYRWYMSLEKEGLEKISSQYLQTAMKENIQTMQKISDIVKQ